MLQILAGKTLQPSAAMTSGSTRRGIFQRPERIFPRQLTFAKRAFPKQNGRKSRFITDARTNILPTLGSVNKIRHEKSMPFAGVFPFPRNSRSGGRNFVRTSSKSTNRVNSNRVVRPLNIRQHRVRPKFRPLWQAGGSTQRKIAERSPGNSVISNSIMSRTGNNIRPRPSVVLPSVTLLRPRRPVVFKTIKPKVSHISNSLPSSGNKIPLVVQKQIRFGRGWSGSRIRHVGQVRRNTKPQNQRGRRIAGSQKRLLPRTRPQQVRKILRVRPQPLRQTAPSGFPRVLPTIIPQAMRQRPPEIIPLQRLNNVRVKGIRNPVILDGWNSILGKTNQKQRPRELKRFRNQGTRKGWTNPLPNKIVTVRRAGAPQRLQSRPKDRVVVHARVRPQVLRNNKVTQGWSKSLPRKRNGKTVQTQSIRFVKPIVARALNTGNRRRKWDASKLKMTRQNAHIKLLRQNNGRRQINSVIQVPSLSPRAASTNLLRTGNVVRPIILRFPQQPINRPIGTRITSGKTRFQQPITRRVIPRPFQVRRLNPRHHKRVFQSRPKQVFLPLTVTSASKIIRGSNNARQTNRIWNARKLPKVFGRTHNAGIHGANMGRKTKQIVAHVLDFYPKKTMAPRETTAKSREATAITRKIMSTPRKTFPGLSGPRKKPAFGLPSRNSQYPWLNSAVLEILKANPHSYVRVLTNKGEYMVRLTNILSNKKDLPQPQALKDAQRRAFTQNRQTLRFANKRFPQPNNNIGSTKINRRTNMKIDGQFPGPKTSPGIQWGPAWDLLKVGQNRDRNIGGSVEGAVKMGGGTSLMKDNISSKLIHARLHTGLNLPEGTRPSLDTKPRDRVGDANSNFRMDVNTKADVQSQLHSSGKMFKDTALFPDPNSLGIADNFHHDLKGKKTDVIQLDSQFHSGLKLSKMGNLPSDPTTGIRVNNINQDVTGDKKNSIYADQGFYPDLKLSKNTDILSDPNPSGQPVIVNQNLLNDKINYSDTQLPASTTVTMDPLSVIEAAIKDFGMEKTNATQTDRRLYSGMKLSTSKLTPSDQNVNENTRKEHTGFTNTDARLYSGLKLSTSKLTAPEQNTFDVLNKLNENINMVNRNHTTDPSMYPDQPISNGVSKSPDLNLRDPGRVRDAVHPISSDPMGQEPSKRIASSPDLNPFNRDPVTDNSIAIQPIDTNLLPNFDWPRDTAASSTLNQLDAAGIANQDAAVDSGQRNLDGPKASSDSGLQASFDSGPKTSSDSSLQSSSDSGIQASSDSGIQASSDSGLQASSDSGPKASSDSGLQPKGESSKSVNIPVEKRPLGNKNSSTDRRKVTKPGENLNWIAEQVHLPNVSKSIPISF